MEYGGRTWTEQLAPRDAGLLPAPAVAGSRCTVRTSPGKTLTWSVSRRTVDSKGRLRLSDESANP